MTSKPFVAGERTRQGTTSGIEAGRGRCDLAFKENTMRYRQNVLFVAALATLSLIATVSAQGKDRTHVPWQLEPKDVSHVFDLRIHNTLSETITIDAVDGNGQFRGTKGKFPIAPGQCKLLHMQTNTGGNFDWDNGNLLIKMHDSRFRFEYLRINWWVESNEKRGRIIKLTEYRKDTEARCVHFDYVLSRLRKRKKVAGTLGSHEYILTIKPAARIWVGGKDVADKFYGRTKALPAIGKKTRLTPLKPMVIYTGERIPVKVTGLHPTAKNVMVALESTGSRVELVRSLHPFRGRPLVLQAQKKPGDYQAWLLVDFDSKRPTVDVRYPFKVVPAPTLSVHQEGRQVAVKFDNHLPGNDKDEIVLSKEGAPLTDAIGRRFTGRDVAGERYFKVPSAGRYEIRFFAGGDRTRLVAKFPIHLR